MTRRAKQSNPVLTFAAAFWQPEPDEPWWKWAERDITLTKYTPTPGPYGTDVMPFCREWIECFRDDTIREVTLCTGTQVGKTQSCLVGTAATIKHRPVEMIWADPSREDAKSMSETRWADIVDHSSLAEEKPSDADRFKKLEQQFRRCTLTWVGAGSEAKLKSRPVGLIVLNEVEAWETIEGHTHPAEEAEQRVKAYDGSKIIRNSTPKFAEGYIWQKYLQGDQRRYFVPCPHCGDKITLEWKQVRWSKDGRVNGAWDFVQVMASACYECQNCKGQITDRHKPAMLRAGEWRATNPGADPAFRSYHLSSLYSPWRSTGFGALAVQFLKAKESLLGLQGFINGALAEPWEDQQYIDPISFPEGDYALETIHVEEKIQVLTVDVQLDHFWAGVRGHGDGMKGWLHFAERVESFDDLEAIHRKFGVAANCAGIDCGYERNGDVYRFAARNHWFALRGDAPREGFYRHTLADGRPMRRIYSVVERIDAFLGTAGSGGFCLRVFFAKSTVDDILQQLLLRVRGDWKTPRDAPKVWLEQINARRKLPKRDPLTGNVTMEWCEVVRKWDHLRDVETMQVVIAAMRGYLRELEPGDGAAAVAPTQPPAEKPVVVHLPQPWRKELGVPASSQRTTAQTAPARRQPLLPRRGGGGFARNW